MKTTSLALLAVLIAGVSAPVFADDNSDSPSFNTDWYTSQLTQKGLDVVDVNGSGPDAIVATVRDADGTQSFQFFDRHTLKPLNAAGGQETRVLSKLDVQAPALKAPAGNLAVLSTDSYDKDSD